jgi:hypothetical protein
VDACFPFFSIVTFQVFVYIKAAVPPTSFIGARFVVITREPEAIASAMANQKTFVQGRK